MPKKTIGKIKNVNYIQTFTSLSKEQISKLREGGWLDPIVVKIYTK